MISINGASLTIAPATSIHLTIELYDLNGRRIETIADDWFEAGATRRYDREKLPTGALVVVRSGSRTIETALLL